MTWGQHLVECSVCTINKLRVVLFPRVSLLPIPPTPPPRGAGEMEKKRDPGKEFASEISIELPFIWFLHRQSKT